MDMLILGMKRHGKTSLGVEMARQYRARNRQIAVLSPKLDDWPRWKLAGAHLVTADRDKFLKILTAPGSWGICAFIDEAHHMIGTGKDAKPFETLLQESGHQGHMIHVLSPRCAPVSKTVRECCDRLAMFRQGPDDCEQMARQFGQPGLRAGVNLPPLRYMLCTTLAGSLKHGAV